MFQVTEAAQRPARMDGSCFYCHQKIGESHRDDCVLIAKNVKVRMTVEYEVKVPASWSSYDIEFHRNDSSWCCGNAIRELEKLNENGCICGITHFDCIDENGAAYLDEQ